MKHTAFISVILSALLVLLPVSAAPYSFKDSARAFGALNVTGYDHIVDITRQALKEKRGDVTLRFSSRQNAEPYLSELGRSIMQDALSHTGEADEGDYLRYQLGGWELHYSSTASGNGYYNELYILPDYYTDLKQEEWVSAECERILSQLSVSALPEEERARSIYEYVCDNVKYDMVDKNFPARHIKSTAYAALKYRTAACQGYAVLMYRLLNAAGVECRVVTGDAVYEGETEYHAWNSFCIEGTWYFLDATWGSMEEEREKYFMKSEHE